MSIKNKQELIDLIKNALVEDLSKIQDKIDIVIEGGDNPKIETIYPKKQLDLQAEKLANVMIVYVNSEIQNLFSSLNQQNAYTVASSDTNTTLPNFDIDGGALASSVTNSVFNNAIISPSQITNYKPIIPIE